MPKNPSPAQVEASKKNGAKGRGPLSAETKQRSSQNARTVGLFANTTACLHEKQEWGQRSHAWHTYYQPLSPASIHLTNECARATLMADRCEAYRDAQLELQVDAESKRWNVQRKRKVDYLVTFVRDQPETTIPKLKVFGAGVRWIMGGIQELIAVLRSRGFLLPEEVEFGIRLFGASPAQPKPYQDVMAYLISLLNMGCTPGASSTVIADWLRPENRPDVLQEFPEDKIFGPDADDNRERLVAELEGELDDLRTLEARLTREVDRPALAAALKRVSILSDKDARRVARSHSEARTTYHRATSALWPMLDREKEEGLAGPASDESDGAGETAGQPAPEPVSAMPDAAGRVGPECSENEPEDWAVLSPQMTGNSTGSVDGQPGGSDLQNGVLSPSRTVESPPPVPTMSPPRTDPDSEAETPAEQRRLQAIPGDHSGGGGAARIGRGERSGSDGERTAGRLL